MDYETYWNVVIGHMRSPENCVREFELEGGTRREIAEWLGVGEAEAEAELGAGETWPEGWADPHHERALDELMGAATVVCIYCDSVVPEAVDPKDLDDNGWRKEAEHHAYDCEWVATRAHSRDAPPAPRQTTRKEQFFASIDRIATLSLQGRVVEAEQEWDTARTLSVISPGSRIDPEIRRLVDQAKRAIRKGEDNV